MLSISIVCFVATVVFLYLFLQSFKSGHMMASLIFLLWLIGSIFFLVASCSSNSPSRRSVSSINTTGLGSYSYSQRYEQPTPSPSLSEIIEIENGTVQPLAKRLPNWKLVFNPKVTITHYAVSCNDNPNCNFRLNGYTFYLKLTVYDENGDYWNSWSYKRVIGWGADGDIGHVNAHKSDPIDPIDCAELPPGEWTYKWTIHTSRP